MQSGYLLAGSPMRHLPGRWTWRERRMGLRSRSWHEAVHGSARRRSPPSPRWARSPPGRRPPRRRPPLTPSSRPRTSRSPSSARRSTTRRSTRPSSPPTAPPRPRRRSPPQAADPGRFFTDDLCWNLANGCAGDIRLDDWATDGVRDRPPGPVHRARRRHALGPRLGDYRSPPTPGEAPGDRHHQRLGPGRRADLLVRRPDPGQGRLRRAHLRPPGPGPVRHPRRVA